MSAEDRGLLGARQILLTAKAVARAPCYHWLYASPKSSGGEEGRLAWKPAHAEGYDAGRVP